MGHYFLERRYKQLLLQKNIIYFGLMCEQMYFSSITRNDSIRYIRFVQ